MVILKQHEMHTANWSFLNNTECTLQTYKPTKNDHSCLILTIWITKLVHFDSAGLSVLVVYLQWQLSVLERVLFRLGFLCGVFIKCVYFHSRLSYSLCSCNSYCWFMIPYCVFVFGCVRIHSTLSQLMSLRENLMGEAIS